MSTFPNLIYEIDLSDKLCNFDAIRIDEFDNRVHDTGYTYSGLTFVFDFTGFTEHFDYSGHSYSNFYLNNDVYTYTGITGETHYFEIYDFYSGATPSVDPLLSGLTIDNVLTGFTSYTTGTTLDYTTCPPTTIITGATTIIPCTEQLSPLTGICCPTESILSNLPWVFTTNHGNGADDCDDFVARRTENGWTLDFVFNRNGLPWSSGGVFFYTGVRDEYEIENYADNNLSFSFTDDGRISWQSIRYSGYCDTVSGYTDAYYTSSGQTPVLCTNGVSDDFNITITFERYYSYSGCSLANEGGWNDLMINNSTVANNEYISDWDEELNNKWLDERWKRLGVLKIYLNGNPIYKIPSRDPLSRSIDHSTDFEEIVLSNRGWQPFVQAVGGGVTGSGGIHEGVSCFDIKYAAYYEDVMSFLCVKEKYTTVTKELYDITECTDECEDSVIGFLPS